MGDNVSLKYIQLTIDKVIMLKITNMVEATAMFLYLKLYAKKIIHNVYISNPSPNVVFALVITRFFITISPIVSIDQPIARSINGMLFFIDIYYR